jgi:hypothetical protein
MNKNNLIKFLVLLIILPHVLFAGESGDELPGEISKIMDPKETKINQNNQILEVDKIEELLEAKIIDTTFPKKRLTHIFGQAFFSKINKENVKIKSKCEALTNTGKCFIVDPKKKSEHFDNYYFYTDINNNVNAIIVFDKRKFTNLSKCKIKMDEWEKYFSNFDLEKMINLNNNLTIIYNDKPQQESIEIFGSCHKEKFRDIDSSFILKLYKTT